MLPGSQENPTLNLPKTELPSYRSAPPHLYTAKQAFIIKTQEDVCVCVCVCVRGCVFVCVWAPVLLRRSATSVQSVSSRHHQSAGVCVCVCVCVRAWLCDCVCVCA